MRAIPSLNVSSQRFLAAFLCGLALLGSVRAGSALAQGHLQQAFIIAYLPWLLLLLAGWRGNGLGVLPLIVILAWIPLPLEIPQIPLTGQMTLAEGVVVLMVILTLVQLLMRQGKQVCGRLRTTPLLLLTLFAAGGLIATSQSSSKVLAFVQWRILCISGLAILYLCMRLIQSVETAMVLVRAAVINVILFTMFLGIAAFAGLVKPFDYFEGQMRFAPSVRLGPLAWQLYANQLGGLVGAALPFVFVYGLSTNSFRGRVVAVIGAGVLGTALILSNGRAATIGVGLALVLVIVLSLVKHSVASLGSALVLLGAAVGFGMLGAFYASRESLALYRWQDLLSYPLADYNVSSRIRLAGYGWDLAVKNPWGIGFYSFKQFYLVGVHNLYLDILHGTGFLGAISLLSLTLFCLWRCWRGLQARDPRVRQLCIGGLGFFVVTAASAMAEPQLIATYSQMLVFWVVFGAIVVATYVADDSPSELSDIPREDCG